MAVQMIPASSSFVTAYGYDARRKELLIEMHGRIYTYEMVPEETFIWFDSMGSKGQALKAIKANYGYH